MAADPAPQSRDFIEDAAWACPADLRFGAMYRIPHADWFWGRRAPALICVMALLSLLALVVGLLRLGPAIDAARGDGVRGVFLAQTLSCSKGCQWDGTFMSAGQIVHGVVYEDSLPPSTHIGSTVPALYPGGYGLKAVFAVHGSTVWIIYVVLLLGGAFGFSSSLWHGPIRYLRRRSLLTGRDRIADSSWHPYRTPDSRLRARRG